MLSLVRGMPSTLLLISSALLSATTVTAVTSYANDFVDPDYIVAKGWNTSTAGAQDTIVGWADVSAAGGPWTVTNKPATPPTGDKRDYMSWAPYWWPDCSKAGNTTELPPDKIYTDCTYYVRDGIFNPDYRDLTDAQSFQNMSDSILYNVLAYVITDDAKYVNNAVSFIDTWFLNNATMMKPNLDFGQMVRGVGQSKGSHVGVLDLKGMVKITSAVLVLRKMKASQWTSEMDSQLNEWCTQYINWLKTADIALEEKAAKNNHGSFYFNQLAAIQILVGDSAGAKSTLMEYFNGIYLNQINADGEQPLEAARTRPYHYRSYNLAAMITNVRLLAYADPTTVPAMWSFPTTAGGTIQKALDFTMAMGVPANEANYGVELLPSVGALASELGDGGSGKYASFLATSEDAYPYEAWFLWNQPLWDSGLHGANTVKGSSGGGDAEDVGDGKGGSVTTQDQDGAGEAMSGRLSRTLMGLGVFVSLMGVLFG